MDDQAENMGAPGDAAGVAVNKRVRVYPDTNAESGGVVMEDFGEMAAEGVDIGDRHFADPARRWAVLLDAGTLVFVDSNQLALDE